MLMLILTLILITIGTYLILLDIFKISKLKKSKILININKKEKKKTTKNIEVILLEYANELSKFIKIDEYKRDNLEINLKSAQIKLSAETYLADVYIKTSIVLGISILSFFINALLGLTFAVATVIVYLKEYNKVNVILKNKKNKIENELPGFAMNIEQELKTNRDILRILEVYQKNSKSSLGRELEITIADMKSGSYEEALRRFETRIGSSQLSEVIRGLIGVLHGNDETLYFRILAKSFKELQFQRLRGIALKRPEKVKKYSAMMLCCLMLIYGVILSYEIINGMSKLF